MTQHLFFFHLFEFSVPIIVDTKLQATDCQWNHDGSVIAICGIKMYGSEKDTNVVIFYSPYGVVSRKSKFKSLKVRILYSMFNKYSLASTITENSWS